MDVEDCCRRDLCLPSSLLVRYLNNQGHTAEQKARLQQFLILLSSCQPKKTPEFLLEIYKQDGHDHPSLPITTLSGLTTSSILTSGQELAQITVDTSQRTFKHSNASTIRANVDNGRTSSPARKFPSRADQLRTGQLSTVDLLRWQ